MGSATRESLGAATATLTEQGATDFATGEQLLAAALVVDGSAALRSALTDDTAPVAGRKGIVRKVFGGYTKAAQAVIESLASGRWSSEDDFVAGVERLGIRALAASAPKTVSIDDELFSFANAVSSNPDLELGLGSRLGSVEGKVALVKRLLDGKASPQTVAILSALIAHPHGRRTDELIRYAATIVAEAAGHQIATITVAAPLSAAQTDRLAKALSQQYGTSVRINQLVDPSVLGGIRVQIGDEVIDGSIANRLADLRLRLAS
jgi:F-type H+-transporting ATPase subunit delta